MGFLAILLTTVFVTLKLAHVIAWSWLIVFSPLIAFLIFALICFVIAAVLFNGVARAVGRGFGW